MVSGHRHNKITYKSKEKTTIKSLAGYNEEGRAERLHNPCWINERKDKKELHIPCYTMRGTAGKSDSSMQHKMEGVQQRTMDHQQRVSNECRAHTNEYSVLL